MTMLSRSFALLLIALLLQPGPAWSDSYSSVLRRYQRQIDQQERQLRSLTSNLRRKEKDAQLWQQKAESSKVRWAQMKKAVAEARGMVTHFRTRWEGTHRMAEAAEWSAIQGAAISRAAEGQLSYLSTELYKARLTPAPFAEEATDEVLKRSVMMNLNLLTDAAHVQTRQAQTDEQRLQKEEKKWHAKELSQTSELDRLRREQENHWLNWQQALRKRQRLEEEQSEIEQSAEALRVMVRELERHRDRIMAERGVRAPRTHVSIPRGSLPWPVDGKVTQNFGRQYSSELNQLLISNGVKISAAPGRVVHAIQQGKVLFASPFRQYGQLVIIQHRNDITSVYGSLGQISVKEGDVVNALAPIGTLSDSGSIYFELRHEEEPIDPLVWLSPKRS